MNLNAAEKLRPETLTSNRSSSETKSPLFSVSLGFFTEEAEEAPEKLQVGFDEVPVNSHCSCTELLRLSESSSSKWSF